MLFPFCIPEMGPEQSNEGPPQHSDNARPLLSPREPTLEARSAAQLVFRGSPCILDAAALCGVVQVFSSQVDSPKKHD